MYVSIYVCLPVCVKERICMPEYWGKCHFLRQLLSAIWQVIHCLQSFQRSTQTVSKNTVKLKVSIGILEEYDSIYLSIHIQHIIKIQKENIFDTVIMTKKCTPCLHGQSASGCELWFVGVNNQVNNLHDEHLASWWFFFVSVSIEIHIQVGGCVEMSASLARLVFTAVYIYLYILWSIENLNCIQTF